MHRSKMVLVKGLALLLVLAGLSALGSTAVWGQSPEEVLIHPWYDGAEYVVPVGHIGVIRQGWAAATRGLVRAWYQVSQREFVLTRNDDPGWSMTITNDEALAYLGPIERTPIYDELCRGHRSMGAWVMYPLTDLEPGYYTLHTRLWVDHPFTDGCDADGDGRTDHVEGAFLDTIVTIKVEGA